MSPLLRTSLQTPDTCQSRDGGRWATTIAKFVCFNFPRRGATPSCSSSDSSPFPDSAATAREPAENADSQCDSRRFLTVLTTAQSLWMQQAAKNSSRLGIFGLSTNFPQTTYCPKPTLSRRQQSAYQGRHSDAEINSRARIRKFGSMRVLGNLAPKAASAGLRYRKGQTETRSTSEPVSDPPPRQVAVKSMTAGISPSATQGRLRGYPAFSGRNRSWRFDRDGPSRLRWVHHTAGSGGIGWFLRVASDRSHDTGHLGHGECRPGGRAEIDRRRSLRCLV